MYRLYIAWHRPILLIYQLFALIDIFVIKLFSYDLKDHTFILQTPRLLPPLKTYKWSLKLNIHFLYWYFQQNQCLKIKKYAVYNIHRLARGSFACVTTGQLSIEPILKIAHKYFVWESRDMSDVSGTYKKILK
jgi:hypothetical protein